MVCWYSDENYLVEYKNEEGYEAEVPRVECGVECLLKANVVHYSTCGREQRK